VGAGYDGQLGHGDKRNQSSPQRVEALRGVRVSGVAFGWQHALALAEDGLVYAWGETVLKNLVLGYPQFEEELLPKPVEALRGVRVRSIAASGRRDYAVADTGELWAWGFEIHDAPLGHGEQMHCPLPKPIESLLGIKVDAVAAIDGHTLAQADDGNVYAWGNALAVGWGALGLGPEVKWSRLPVRNPRRVSALQ
jgi:alpha-tubulin suppressor-like RCC1 family protein